MLHAACCMPHEACSVLRSHMPHAACRCQARTKPSCTSMVIAVIVLAPTAIHADPRPHGRLSPIARFKATLTTPVPEPSSSTVRPSKTPACRAIPRQNRGCREGVFLRTAGGSGSGNARSRLQRSVRRWSLGHRCGWHGSVQGARGCSAIHACMSQFAGQMRVPATATTMKGMVYGCKAVSSGHDDDEVPCSHKQHGRPRTFHVREVVQSGRVPRCTIVSRIISGGSFHCSDDAQRACLARSGRHPRRRDRMLQGGQLRRRCGVSPGADAGQLWRRCGRPHRCESANVGAIPPASTDCLLATDGEHGSEST